MVSGHLRHSSHRVTHPCETEMKMQIGYARTSTLDQTAGFEAQLTELAQAGCEKAFSEQVSSVAPRAQLAAALEYIREGDVLVVSTLDRLARSTQHLLEIVDRVKRKGAPLQIVNLGMDTSTATGKLLLTMIGAIGQFEREMMLESSARELRRPRARGSTRDEHRQHGPRPHGRVLYATRVLERQK